MFQQVQVVCDRGGHSAVVVVIFTRAIDSNGERLWLESWDDVEVQTVTQPLPDLRGSEGAFQRLIIRCSVCGLNVEMNAKLPLLYAWLDTQADKGSRFASLVTLAAIVK